MPKSSSTQLIEKSRKKRTSQLRRYVLPLKKAGITPTHLTTLSLATGLTAAYYLFQNHTLFIIFALLHLFFDSIDGVLARETTPTRKGAYADSAVDNFVAVIILIKTAIMFTNPWLTVITALYTAYQVAYFTSHMKLTPFSLRTTLILIYALTLFDIAIAISIIATLARFTQQVTTSHS